MSLPDTDANRVRTASGDRSAPGELNRSIEGGANLPPTTPPPAPRNTGASIEVEADINVVPGNGNLVEGNTGNPPGTIDKAELKQRLAGGNPDPAVAEFFRNMAKSSEPENDNQSNVRSRKVGGITRDSLNRSGKPSKHKKLATAGQRNANTRRGFRNGNSRNLEGQIDSSDISSENQYHQQKLREKLSKLPRETRKALHKGTIAYEVDTFGEDTDGNTVRKSHPTAKKLSRSVSRLQEKIDGKTAIYLAAGGDPSITLPKVYQDQAMAELNQEMEEENIRRELGYNQAQQTRAEDQENSAYQDSELTELERRRRQPYPPPEVQGLTARRNPRIKSRSHQPDIGLVAARNAEEWQRNQPRGTFNEALNNVRRKIHEKATTHGIPCMYPRGTVSAALGGRHPLQLQQTISSGNQPRDFRRHLHPPGNPKEYEDDLLSLFAEEVNRRDRPIHSNMSEYALQQGHVPDVFGYQPNSAKKELAKQLMKLMKEQGKPRQNSIAPAPETFSLGPTIWPQDYARSEHIARVMPNTKHNTFTGGQRRDDVGIVTLLTRLTRAQNILVLSREEFLGMMLDYFQGPCRQKLESLISEPDVSVARVYQRLLEIYHSKDSIQDAWEKLAKPKENIHAKNMADAGAEIGTIASSAVRDIRGPRKSENYHMLAIKAFLEIIPATIKHAMERDINEHKDIYDDEPTFEEVLNLCSKYQNTVDYHILKTLGKNEKKVHSSYASAKLSRGEETAVVAEEEENDSESTSSSSSSDSSADEGLYLTKKTFINAPAGPDQTHQGSGYQPPLQNFQKVPMASGMVPPKSQHQMREEHNQEMYQQQMPQGTRYHQPFHRKSGNYVQQGQPNFNSNNRISRPTTPTNIPQAPNTINPFSNRTEPIPKGPNGKFDLYSGPCWSCGSTGHPSFECPLYPYSGLPQNPCRNCDLGCYHPEHLCHVMLVKQMHAAAEKNHQQLVAQGKEHLKTAPSAASVAEAAVRPTNNNNNQPPPKNGQ